MGVSIKGLGSILREFNEKWNKIKIEKKRLLNRTAGDVVKVAVSLTPVQSWNLSRSYKVQKGKGKKWDSVEIINNSSYFRYIDEGTKAHFIFPKKRKMLRFVKNGKIVYSKWHKVKWIKAFKIAEKTVDKVLNSKLRKNLTKFINNITKK